jgi:hypothetical protein
MKIRKYRMKMKIILGINLYEFGIKTQILKIELLQKDKQTIKDKNFDNKEYNLIIIKVIYKLN